MSELLLLHQVTVDSYQKQKTPWSLTQYKRSLSTGKITIFDLLLIPDDEEILRQVAEQVQNILGSAGDLMTKSKRKSIVSSARAFLSEYLYIDRLPVSLNRTLKRFENGKMCPEQLIQSLKYNGRAGNNTFAASCAALKVLLACAYYHNNPGLKDFQGHISQIEEILLYEHYSSPSFIQLDHDSFESPLGYPVIVNEKKGAQPVLAWMRARGKQELSVIGKLVRRPTADLHNIIGDGMGFGFLISDEGKKYNQVTAEAELVMRSFLLKLSHHGYGVEVNRISEANFLVADSDDEAKNHLRQFLDGICEESMGGITVSNQLKVQTLQQAKLGENSSRSVAFQDYKVTGVITSPGGGASQTFELRVELQSNTNYEGYQSVPVYKLKSRLEIVSRLMGRCTEGYVRRLCSEAAREEAEYGLCSANCITSRADNIFGYLCEDFLIPTCYGKDSKSFHARSVVQSWDKCGMPHGIPNSIKVY